MNRTPIWIALILVIGALVFGALIVNAPDRRLFVPELDNPMVMRVYDVPPERAQDVRVALATALQTGGDTVPSLGRVTLSGTNQIVVLAPLSTQSTIAAAIEKLGGGTSAAPNGGGSVRLSTWLVDALPGAGPDDPATAPIADALGAARATLGEVHFRVHDAVAMTGLPNGGRMQAFSGRRTAVEAHLRPIAGGVQVELKVGGDQPGSLETTAALAFQQTLVLAQLARAESGDSAPGAMRLFVVRAEPVGGG
jgi:hypothetical protein